MVAVASEGNEEWFFHWSLSFMRQRRWHRSCPPYQVVSKLPKVLHVYLLLLWQHLWLMHIWALFCSSSWRVPADFPSADIAPSVLLLVFCVLGILPCQLGCEFWKVATSVSYGSTLIFIEMATILESLLSLCEVVAILYIFLIIMSVWSFCATMFHRLAGSGALNKFISKKFIMLAVLSAIYFLSVAVMSPPLRLLNGSGTLFWCSA